MNKLLNVSFHDDEVTIVNHNGEPYVPMKHIVENIGLDWRSQLVKINDNPKRWGVAKITIPTKGGLQKMVCVPMRKLFGWLATISPKKVKAELKEKIIQYQNECDDVLWDYWSNKINSAQVQLNALYQQESLSKAKGSFHGKGLYQRKVEKNTLQPMIEAKKREVQPSLFITV